VSLIDLALLFLRVGAVSFGGGSSVLAELQHDLVDQRAALTQQQFLTAYALGQATPGPGILFLVPMGFYAAGAPGAIVALVAFMVPPLFLQVIVASQWERLSRSPWIRALDRTLGFLFGLARGLLIVVVAYQFFIWLVPDKQRPDWVTNAKSRTVLDGTGQWLMSLLPDDPENTILKRFKKNKPDDEQTDTDQAAPPSGDGYSKPARDSLKKLIEKPAAR